MGVSGSGYDNSEQLFPAALGASHILQFSEYAIIYFEESKLAGYGEGFDQLDVIQHPRIVFGVELADAGEGDILPSHWAAIDDVYHAQCLAMAMAVEHGAATAANQEGAAMVCRPGANLKRLHAGGDQ